MTHRISRRARVLAAGLGAGVIVPFAAAAAPAGPATAPQVSCTSSKTGLATKLQTDITTALKGRAGTVAVGLYDRSTKTTCTLRSSTAYDSASVVKATVLATLLWDAKKHNRYLTTREQSLATAMITQSDNNATSTLWKQLGVTKVKGFLAAAGMTQTKPGANNYWGLTQITVRDEQKLLALLTAKNSVLSDDFPRLRAEVDGQGHLLAALTYGRSAPPRSPCTSRTAGCRVPRTAGACTASARSTARATTT